MPWNYRVAHFRSAAPDDEHFQIVECYYDEGVALPHSWCEATIGGETLDELKDDLAHISRALERPVIEIGEDDKIAGETPNPLSRPAPTRPARKTPRPTVSVRP